MKKIIEQSTDKITDKEPDPVLNFSKGTYSNKHSEWFGFGKVNAAKAVKKAYDLSPAKKDTPSPSPPKPKIKAIKDGVLIIAALVNPKGKESGNEKISLLNITDKTVDLNGWKIEINGKNRQIITNQIIEPNNFLTVKSKDSLSNSGGSIGLFNPEDELVHKVKYGKKDASKNGWTTVFK